MKMLKSKAILVEILALILFIPLVSAAHYIVGYVEDALDGTAANGHTVVLWNPNNGINDNLTDIIGPSGNSGVDNIYMIDCELLSQPCKVGDNLSVKVINNGDNYISEIENVTVQGLGYDVVENLSLNSPPTANLNYPQNNQNFSYKEITFNCSFEDLDSNLANITLYGNWSGGWHANETKIISGGSGEVIFKKNISQGLYKWNCKVTDDLGISSFALQNKSFTIDLTPPTILSIGINESYVCGNKKIRVNCTANDIILEIDKVIIQAISPSKNKQNYTASLLSGDTYYSDIFLDEIGDWKFNCIANDTLNNVANLTSEIFYEYSTTPDFFVNKILFSNENPIEKEIIKINATITNNGCQDATVLIGFYENDPELNGVNIENKTINIQQLSSSNISVNWNAKIGPTNIFVFADSNSTFNENNETDNKANKTINVIAWQYFFGNVSINKLIGYKIYNMSLWLNESNLAGNIFVADKESKIDWSSLIAIGKNTTGGNSLNDFSEIDSVLGMTNFNDSVSRIFSNNQQPKKVKDFFIYQKTIEDVPIINSTNNTNFVTGILWDSSDDTNGEYDANEKEDLIFITEINKNKQGAYGVYDYEIRVPVKLRDLYNSDQEEVYFYYDLN